MKRYILSKDRLVVQEHNKTNLDDFLCKICNNIAFDPLCCNSCGKLFCSYCINKYQKEENYTCLCFKPKAFLGGLPNFLFTKFIKLIFQCRYYREGCRALLRHSEILDHEAGCELQPVTCRFSPCTYRSKGTLVREHQQNCGYRPIRCEKCGLYVKINQTEKHKQECDFSLHDCSGCKKSFLKKDLEEHMDFCPEVEIKCNHCDKVFLKPEFNSHMQLECIEKQIRDYKNRSEYCIKEFNKEINKLLIKLEHSEKYYNTFCHYCLEMSCQTHLTKCKLCSRYSCINCKKTNYRHCSDCKKECCKDCLSASNSNKECFRCIGPDITKGMSSCRIDRKDVFRKTKIDKVLVRLNK